MVKDGEDWTILKDLDGMMRDTNPYGNNLGHGLTGSGSQKLRFDFSPYRGKTVTLRLRYKTDASTTGAGWWVDDIALDNSYITRFEIGKSPVDLSPLDQFPALGWLVVPTTTSYPNYYLVEWRTATKYDRMLKTAYVKNIDDEDEWKVERVPYNIPGALLYYCNTRYSNGYQLALQSHGFPQHRSRNILCCSWT